MNFYNFVRNYLLKKYEHTFLIDINFSEMFPIVLMVLTKYWINFVYINIRMY